jgi:ribosomal protein RSM22 (predicted rRNA methylase)
VLIDHNTKEGFEVIGQAREFLLRQGRKEMESKEGQEAENTEADPAVSPRGSYVVAPVTDSFHVLSTVSDISA